MNFWEDPTFQFIVLATAAIIAIIIPVILYWKTRQKKALSYTVSSSPLLSVKDEIKKKVQILYDGKPVEQVHLTVFKIINSGNVPITPEDYKTPIALNFGKDSEILTGSITKTEPENLEPTFHFKSGIATVEPLLLNRKDFITINMLVKKYENISISGRIVGVKEIKLFKKASRKYSALYLAGMFMVGFGVAAVTSLGLGAWGTIIAIAGTLLALYASTRTR